MSHIKVVVNQRTRMVDVSLSDQATSWLADHLLIVYKQRMRDEYRSKHKTFAPANYPTDELAKKTMAETLESGRGDSELEALIVGLGLCLAEVLKLKSGG